MNSAEEMAHEIANDIHHGECFYEIKMLTDLLIKIDILKGLVKEKYEETQEDMRE